MIINGIERTYIVHDDTQIKGFFGEYRFLSNFEQTPVYFEGRLYPATENAYMAAKTLDLAVREVFLDIEPKEAKKLGRKIILRPDWEQVKFDVMLSINVDKYYRNLDLRAKLLATGAKYLEETNHWQDVIWGVCDGQGWNMLGQTLMNVRTLFRNLETYKPQ